MISPADDQAEHIGWHLDVYRPEDLDAPFVVIADLHVIQNERFVGVTFGSTVVLPKRVRASDVPVEPLRDAIAKLFGETLWDACSLVARQMAAMTVADGFVLPQKPPHSGSVEDDDQHLRHPDESRS